MEEILTDYNKKMYKKRHDDFYIEIEANVKAINKLIRFIDLNNINDDQVSKKLEKLKEKYLNNLLNYKFNAFFQEFIKCCDEYKLYTNNKYRIVNLFYNQNGEYKSIVDILNDKNFKNLDFEMKVLILYNIILDKDELKIKTKRRR